MVRTMLHFLNVLLKRDRSLTHSARMSRQRLRKLIGCNNEGYLLLFSPGPKSVTLCLCALSGPGLRRQKVFISSDEYRG
jgi:hypothetical protein